MISIPEISDIEDLVKKKVSDLVHKTPKKIEIRSPPKKNPGIPYISLASLGIKQQDKIAVVEYDDAIVVWIVRR
ncbi:MAG: hypothetical protein QXU26_01430 [Thermofilaceae archaeon]